MCVSPWQIWTRTAQKNSTIHFLPRVYSGKPETCEVQALFTINLCVLMLTTFQMGNASDTSAVFASTISKERDILMGSLYSVFCKSTTRKAAGAPCPAHDQSLFCFTGVLSLVGNCILLLVAYHKRSTLKPAEFFIINLSISDLGMTLSLFPLAIPSAFKHRCHTSCPLSIIKYFTKKHNCCKCLLCILI